jgi:nickel transport system ATP-binding protein
MDSGIVLSVKDVSIRLSGGRELVSGASFDIGKSEVACLIGESGCGKSLTCLALMGLLPKGVEVSGGSVEFMGRDLLALDKKSMRALRGDELTMILQNPMSCFDQVFTVSSHFRETLAAHGVARGKDADAAAEAALSRVGFESPREILGLYPFQMSGGMLQRVMVALAISTRASLLVADEPTTDLDLASQRKVLDLLMDIKEERGLSMLLVTHDLGVVARCADSVAVMRRGRIVERASSAELFGQGVEGYARDLVDAHAALYRGAAAEAVLGRERA